MSTCQNNVFTWISVDKYRLIPNSRYILHKINHKIRIFIQIIWRDTKVLYRCLEQYRCRQLKGFTRFADSPTIVLAVMAFVEQYRPEIHRTDRIPDKRMQ